MVPNNAPNSPYSFDTEFIDFYNYEKIKKKHVFNDYTCILILIT